MTGYIDEHKMNMLLISFVLFTGIILYWSAIDINASVTTTYSYIFAACIPFIALIGYMIYENGLLSILPSNIMLFVYACGALVFIVVAMYFGIESITYYITNALLFGIVVAALAIFVQTFSIELKPYSGGMGIIPHVILFLPCLFQSGVTEFMKQFNLTDYVTFVLLGIEATLIAFYIMYLYVPVPKITNDIVLQKSPIFLDIGKETPIANSDILKVNGKLPANYSLSFWLQLNTQETSPFQEIKLLSFKSPDESQLRPRISFAYNAILHTQVYRIYTRSKNSYYELVVPSQRKNFFVFTYQDNIVDLFVNGTLHKSFPFTVNEPLVLSDADLITMGDPTYRLSGAISNIVYHNIPLSASQVATSFNLGTSQIISS